MSKKSKKDKKDKEQLEKNFFMSLEALKLIGEGFHNASNGIANVDKTLQKSCNLLNEVAFKVEADQRAALKEEQYKFMIIVGPTDIIEEGKYTTNQHNIAGFKKPNNLKPAFTFNKRVGIGPITDNTSLALDLRAGKNTSTILNNNKYSAEYGAINLLTGFNVQNQKKMREWLNDNPDYLEIFNIQLSNNGNNSGTSQEPKLDQ